MNRWRGILMCLPAMLFAAVACAGDGTGLDAFGRPLGTDTPELAPTLSSIQANIFGPICAQCHTGAAAPLGLRLDPGVSHEHLVGVPSTEKPEVLRVTPGRPDSSYLVWKIEGRPEAVGGQMPLGLPSLTGDQIIAIRVWIANGAAED